MYFFVILLMSNRLGSLRKCNKKLYVTDTEPVPSHWTSRLWVMFSCKLVILKFKQQLIHKIASMKHKRDGEKMQSKR